MQRKKKLSPFSIFDIEERLEENVQIFTTINFVQLNKVRNLQQLILAFHTCCCFRKNTRGDYLFDSQIRCLFILKFNVFLK